MHGNDPRQPATQRRRRYVVRRRQRRHFHWWLIVPILPVLFLMWLSPQPSFTWSTVMDLLNVSDRERYTKLALLGVIGTTVVAILRVVRGRKKRNNGS